MRGISPSSNSITSPLFNAFIKHYTKWKWATYLINILKNEEQIDYLLFLSSVPASHVSDIVLIVKQKIRIPVVYYDGDMPTSLPRYAVERGFKFNGYDGADLSEFDVILVNSEGGIPDLMEMGAKNIHALLWKISKDTVGYGVVFLV
jgi:hypothetical protein